MMARGPDVIALFPNVGWDALNSGSEGNQYKGKQSKITSGSSRIK